jgi:hypothetical protein
VGNSDIEGRPLRLPVYSIDFVGDVVVDVVNDCSSLESDRSGEIPRVVADRGSGRRECDGRGRAEGLTERANESVSSMTLERLQGRGG